MIRSPAPIAYPLAAPPLARGIADRLIDEAVASSTFRLGIALLLRDFYPSGLACRTNRIAGKRTTAKRACAPADAAAPCASRCLLFCFLPLFFVVAFGVRDGGG